MCQGLLGKNFNKTYSSAILADKLKTLRYDLKKWKVSLSRIKLLIQNCNKVILALDNLEELRPLFRAEFNFQKIVKLHLEDLLLAECNYCRKRCTIRWIKQGEDNTQKFHAMATERLSMDFVPQEHGVPRDGPKDSNAGAERGDLGSQRNTVMEASRRRTHNTLQRQTPSFTQVQGPHGEVKPLLPAFLYYDAIPREEYRVLITEP
jgi:hypothetical protein